jgi:hypothetical protein
MQCKNHHPPPPTHHPPPTTHHHPPPPTTTHHHHHHHHPPPPPTTTTTTTTTTHPPTQPVTPCRFLTEQVSHHPPVSAIYADGLSELGGGYVLHGEVELRTKFWGRSIQLLLAGHCQLTLPGSGDRFIWNRPPMSVNDIILGEALLLL